MTTASLLFCLTALLTIYSHSHAAGNINCRKFVYHPKCRGVAAKRADLPALLARGHPLSDAERERKQDDDLSEPEYLPVPVPVTLDVTNDVLPRRGGSISGPALWSYLAERPGNILLPLATATRRKQDPETLELSYDYE